MNRINYKLRDLLQIKNGKDHKDLGDGNIPVYGTGGIMRYADKSLYEEESILLPRKGTLSNIQYVNIPFWTVDTIYYTVVNSEIANTFFLYNYLKTLDLSGLNSGTGVPSMTFDSYYNLEIYLPTLKTQHQIASVLSALDAKIELNNKINAELEAMAKTIYDYWFVQFDFPNAEGKPYKTSGGKMVYNEELKREIPEGWGATVIEDILAKEPSAKKTPSSDFLKEGLFPIIDQSTDFIAGFTNDEDAVIKASQPRIVFGDHTRIVKFINFNFARGADGTQVLLSSSKQMPQHLFYHTILKIDLSNYGYARHFKFLKERIIILPKEDIANKFESEVENYYKMIRENRLQNQHLSSLRDWLLPMLMNGQVTVGAAQEVLGMVAEDRVGYGDKINQINNIL
jgi:type I restriction enzyme S subunit